MLTIREAQMDAFAQAALRERLWEHVREFFPERCASFAPGGLQEFLDFGMRRASRYKFTGSAEICQYADLMFLLGPEFDTDPGLPWAQKILHHDGYTPELRMDLLFAAAVDHLQSEGDGE